MGLVGTVRVVTVLEFLTDRAGLSPERAAEHLRSGFVRVDQCVTRDGGVEVPSGARVTLQPGPVTEHV